MSGRPKLVVSSAWPPAVGGAVTFSLRLVSHPRLADRVEVVRHQVLKRPSMFIEADIPKLRGGLAKARKVGSAVGNLASFVSILAFQRPELVQLHYNGPFAGPLFREAGAMLWLSRISGARTIVRQGGPFQFSNADPNSLVGSMIARRYVRYIDALVVQCETWKSAYEDWISAAGISSIVAAIPNTVDTTVFSPAPAGAKHRKDYIAIGSIAGPQTRIKGAHILLDALVRLAQQFSSAEVRLSVLSESASFRQAAARQNLTDYIDFLGVVRGSARIDWLQQLDIFVLPSLREGFPNVVLEAMACGIPVIASPVGAIPSLIRNGENGLIAERGDADDLAFQIATLIRSPEWRSRFAEEGRATVHQGYRQDGPWIDGLLGVYDRLLSGKS